MGTPSGTARTQLSLSGYGTRRYGSFIGKAIAATVSVYTVLFEGNFVPLTVSGNVITPVFDGSFIDMATQIRNFAAVKGDTIRVIVDPVQVNGVDVDPASVVKFVAKYPDLAAPTTTLSAETGSGKSTFAAGKATLVVEASANAVVGKFFYDVQVTDPAPDPDEVYTIIKGEMLVEEEAAT